LEKHLKQLFFFTRNYHLVDWSVHNSVHYFGIRKFEVLLYRSLQATGYSNFMCTVVGIKAKLEGNGLAKQNESYSPVLAMVTSLPYIPFMEVVRVKIVSAFVAVLCSLPIKTGRIAENILVNSKAVTKSRFRTRKSN